MSKKLLFNVSEEPNMINASLIMEVSSLVVQTYFAFESSPFVVHLTRLIKQEYFFGSTGISALQIYTYFESTISIHILRVHC